MIKKYLFWKYLKFNLKYKTRPSNFKRQFFMRPANGKDSNTADLS